MVDRLLLILLNKYVPKDPLEIEHLLRRAKANRVEYFTLLKLSNLAKGNNSMSKIVKERFEQLGMKKAEYALHANKLLSSLVRQGIDFMVIKEANYPHVSVDLDLLFKTYHEFDRSLPHLKRSKIHVDPHVPGIREFKGAYAKIPVDDLWSRSVFRELYGVKVRVPCPEDQVLIHLTHCIKHREIQLGDLIAILNVRFDEKKLRPLINRYRLPAMYSFVYYLLRYLGIRKFNFNLMTPYGLLLRLQAKRAANSCFPLKIPFICVATTACHLPSL
ncbi:hypothetical protein DRN86_00140 [Candidatus Geothermarchaeota archaeon]|nr:MAG: hypothetical protein DRN86_00140 [Candidatus Geothermarchaeota archaeon]